MKDTFYFVTCIISFTLGWIAVLFEDCLASIVFFSLSIIIAVILLVRSSQPEVEEKEGCDESEFGAEVEE